MAEQLNYQINVTGNAGDSIGSLKKQLREAQNEVAALSDKFGATSEAAISAAKRAADLKDRIGDAKALTDAFNPDAKFKALSASLSGIAGGFSAVQGAIGLIGVESKDVEKMLLKVQSAMALSQGLQAIGESIDSFKQLGAVIKSTTLFQQANAAANKVTASTMKLFGMAVDETTTSFKLMKGAIAATGIGLLVIAVGELVNAFQNYQSSAEKAEEAQKKLNQSIKDGANVQLQAEQRYLDNQARLEVARAKNKGATEKQIFEIEERYRKLKGESQIRYWKEVKDRDGKAALDAENAINNINTEGAIARLDFQTKQNEEAAKRRKEAADKKKQEDEAEEKRMNEGRERARKAGLDFDIMMLNKQEKDKEKAKQDAEDQAKADEEYLAKQWEIEEQVQEAKIETTNRIISENKRRTQADLDAYIAKKEIQGAEIDLLGQLSGVLKQVAGKNKALQSAAVIAENAAGIGRIIVNTQVANAKSVAASPLTAGQPWVTINTISGALGVASSLLATKKALADIGAGGSAGTAPSMGGNTTAPIQPQAATPQVTQLNQASINALGNQAVRAYVVENDVSTSQQRIAAIKARARFE